MNLDLHCKPAAKPVRWKYPQTARTMPIDPTRGAGERSSAHTDIWGFSTSLLSEVSVVVGAEFALAEIKT
jgi:hypothetical protein